jgi:hypothetical protein
VSGCDGHGINLGPVVARCGAAQHPPQCECLIPGAARSDQTWTDDQPQQVWCETCCRTDQFNSGPPPFLEVRWMGP